MDSEERELEEAQDDQEEVGEAESNPKTSRPSENLRDKAAKTTDKSQDSEEPAWVYDIDLRSKRIVAYKDLWQELKLLRKHDPPSPISYGEVKALITKCTTWYYDNGNGMYLTEMSRKTFFAFLGNLQKTVENKKDVDSVHMDYLGEHSDKEKNVKGSGLRNDASILRTVLLKDIGTRKEPHLDFGNKISRFKIKEDLKINGITIKETTSPEVPSNKTGHP